MRKKLSITIILMGVFVLLFAIRCSSSSSSGEDTLTDTQVDPVSKICSNLPKCFSNSYPAFFGKSKKECMSKLEEIVSSDDIDALLEAGSKCSDITPIINKYEGLKTCEIIKGCLGDTKFIDMLGTIENCVQFFQQQGIKEEEFRCVDSNSSDCDTSLNYCLARFAPDAGGEDVLLEDGSSNKKACITDTDTYYCEDVCNKYYRCTGRYCPPDQGNCTKESCLKGCETEDKFSVELMCCIIEKECSEINTCVPQ